MKPARNKTLYYLINSITLYRIIIQYYRTRGSEDSIHTFFKIFFCSFFVELITPYNPFDPSSLSLMEAFTPPSWTDDGLSKFILSGCFVCRY